jgi:hypothetical protein
LAIDSSRFAPSQQYDVLAATRIQNDPDRVAPVRSDIRIGGQTGESRRERVLAHPTKSQAGEIEIVNADGSRVVLARAMIIDESDCPTDAAAGRRRHAERIRSSERKSGIPRPYQATSRWLVGKPRLAGCAAATNRGEKQHERPGIHAAST